MSSSLQQSIADELVRLRSDNQALQAALADVRKTSTPTKWAEQLREQLDEQQWKLLRLREDHQALESNKSHLEDVIVALKSELSKAMDDHDGACVGGRARGLLIGTGTQALPIHVDGRRRASPPMSGERSTPCAAA